MVLVFITFGFIGICMSIYMVKRAFHDVITEEQLYFDDLPPAFVGAKIFFIADVHRRKINQATINQIDAVDYVFLGGDMIEKYVPFQRLVDNLSLLKNWDVPIFFVAGNNDYEKDEKQLKQLLEHHGVIILENETYELVRNGSVMNLLGMPYVEDEEERTFPLDILTNKKYFLLCHSPYTYYHLSNEERSIFSFVFAGHTHGGQIRFFGFGPYKRGGWRIDQDRAIFITEGYGYSLLPFRLETEAQCHVFTMLEKHD